MKFLWLIALLILTAAGFFGWRSHARRDAARAGHEALMAETGGLDRDPKTVIAKARVARRAGPDRKVDGKAISKEFITFALERTRVEEPIDESHEISSTKACPHSKPLQTSQGCICRVIRRQYFVAGLLMKGSKLHFPSEPQTGTTTIRLARHSQCV